MRKSILVLLIGAAVLVAFIFSIMVLCGNGWAGAWFFKIWNTLTDADRDYDTFVAAAFTANLFTAFFDELSGALSAGLAYKCGLRNENCLLRATKYAEQGQEEIPHPKQYNGMIIHNNNEITQCERTLKKVARFFKHLCVITAILSFPIFLFDWQNQYKPWSILLAFPFILFIGTALLVHVWHTCIISDACGKYVGMCQDDEWLRSAGKKVRKQISELQQSGFGRKQ